MGIKLRNEKIIDYKDKKNLMEKEKEKDKKGGESTLNMVINIGDCYVIVVKRKKIKINKNIIFYI